MGTTFASGHLATPRKPLAECRPKWAPVCTVRCVSACVVYNTQTMRSFGSRQYVHCTSLVAVVVLLCIGVLLSWPANGAVDSGSHAKADGYQIAQSANGDEHPLNGSYLVIFAEEAEGSSKGPVNAHLLTALLLEFFGTTVGWLLAYDQRKRIFYFSVITRRPPFVTTREDTPFLGVFRL